MGPREWEATKMMLLFIPQLSIILPYRLWIGSDSYRNDSYRNAHVAVVHHGNTNRPSTDLLEIDKIDDL